MTTNLTLTAAAFASGKFGQGLSAGKGTVALVPTLPFTVELWVATTAAVVQVAVGGSNSSIQFWMGTNASGFAQASAGSGSDAVGTTKVNDGLLHHIAVVYTASGSSLYVDGSAQGTISSAPSSAAGLNVGVGAFAAPINGGDYPFSGLIDEVRISTIARYTAPFTPSATAFVRDATTTALWHLDGNGLDDPGTAAGAAPAAATSAPGAAPAPGNAMVSQSCLEVLGKGFPKVTVAQSQLEVLGKTNPAALVSQSFLEVLFRPSSSTPGPRPRRVFVAMT